VHRIIIPSVNYALTEYFTNLLFLFVSSYILLYGKLYFCGVQRMEYITAKEAAEKWGISQCRVRFLCEQGRVVGAARLGWAWAIPKEADKPADARIKVKDEI